MAAHRFVLRACGGLGNRRFGWPKSPRWRAEHGFGEPPERPEWSSVATGGSHCGAGCALGDVIAPERPERIEFGLGATIASLALWPEYIGDYVPALSFGIAFQYFAIGTRCAASGSARGWWRQPRPTSIGMIVGYFTAWPVNVWLIGKGIKEAM